MPTFSKIPFEVIDIGAIGIAGYAIYCRGLLKAAAVCDKLHKADLRKGIPLCGYMQYKGEKVYYCRYGFVEDPDIYE